MTPTITVSQTGGVTLTVAYQTNVPSFTGTTGSTDNAILRASGTSGTVIQGSLPTIADDGTLDAPAITINGDPVALKETERTIFIPLAQIFGTGQHPATLTSYAPVVGLMYKVLDFPSSNNITHQAEFDLIFPPDRDTSQDFTVELVWRNPGYPTATGSINWQLKAESFASNQSPDATLAGTYPASLSPDNPIRNDTFTVDYPSSEGDFWRFQISRIAGDNFTGSAYLLAVRITYQTI